VEVRVLSAAPNLDLQKFKAALFATVRSSSLQAHDSPQRMYAMNLFLR
jgi:hypothetical protein